MMDDLDGYSCSDSGEDEVRFEEIRSEEEEELVGGCLLRIAFRGGNTAEAIEDKLGEIKLITFDAKNR